MGKSLFNGAPVYSVNHGDYIPFKSYETIIEEKINDNKTTILGNLELDESQAASILENSTSITTLTSKVSELESNIEALVADKADKTEIPSLDEYVKEADVANKIERVELECDDNNIILVSDGSVLSYEQIKALVDDTTKFVTLKYMGIWWMLPAYDDGGAIMFTSSDIEGGHPMTTRVIINTDGQMSNYGIIGEDADHKTEDLSIENAADGHLTYPTTKAINEKFAEILATIEDNELVLAAALNKLNERLNALEGAAN